MASVRLFLPLLFLTATFSALLSETFAGSLLKVECKSAVGVIGETTRISCSFKSNYDDITIVKASIRRKEEREPFIKLQRDRQLRDSRFQLQSESDPSVLITNTLVSDQGEYYYTVMTTRGNYEDAPFKISVTAKYSKPVMNSWPEEVQNHQPAVLYCNTTGGYPAGSVHWFDRINTDWTKSSSLVTTQRDDQLLSMSSTLTFSSLDLSWAPFRCVVYSNTSTPEEESDLIMHEKYKGDEEKDSQVNQVSQTAINIVAPVIVIGSLVVGLLSALLVFRRHNRGSFPVNTDEADFEAGQDEALDDQMKLNEEAPEKKT